MTPACWNDIVCEKVMRGEAAGRSEEEATHLACTGELAVWICDYLIESRDKRMCWITDSVSHDLRAPLRSIDGYSRMLLEDYSQRLDDDGRTFIRNVR